MSKLLSVVLLAWCCVSALAQDASQPAQAANQPVRVSAAVMTGMVDHKVLPQYPKQAMTQGVQGDVIFNITVDETGKIVHSQVVKGAPLLVDASEDALRDYHFRPYLLNGTPVRVESQMGYQFTLTRKGDSIDGHVECMTAIP